MPDEDDVQETQDQFNDAVSSLTIQEKMAIIRELMKGEEQPIRHSRWDRMVPIDD